MRLKLLGLLLTFAAVLYWQDSTSDDAMDKYISEYKKFQAQADSATKFADSLAQEIVIADNEARAAQSRASVYSKQATELKNETLNLMDRAQLLTETITDTLELARQILPLKDSIVYLFVSVISAVIFSAITKREFLDGILISIVTFFIYTSTYVVSFFCKIKDSDFVLRVLLLIILQMLFFLTVALS